VLAAPLLFMNYLLSYGRGYIYLIKKYNKTQRGNIANSQHVQSVVISITLVVSTLVSSSSSFFQIFYLEDH